MLTIDQSKNADGAARYYTAPEYHAGERLAAPEWGGQGAAIFKLSGEVDPHHFSRLCHNRYPKAAGANAKKSITPRNSPERRVLYDVQFAPPKSVSLAIELADRTDVFDAFQRAVRSTMKVVESHAAVRTRDATGKTVDQTTGVLTYALWWHGLSRPVNGLSDPQIHAHATVLAHTYDHQKGRFMALQTGRMWGEKTHNFERYFHHELRQNLHLLGYKTYKCRNGHTGWELAGVPKFVAVPQKYFYPDQSGIKTTTKPGATTFDITLGK